MPSDLLMDGQEDLVEVKVFYRVRKNAAGNRIYTILPADEGQKALDAEEEDVDVLETRWSPQTWQLNNSIMKESMQFNKISGSNEIDWSAYQNKMIQYCLKEWNVTTRQGEPVAPTVDNVGLMPATIVAAMVREYDKTMKVDEEEKKG